MSYVIRGCRRVIAADDFRKQAEETLHPGEERDLNAELAAGEKGLGGMNSVIRQYSNGL